MGISPSPSLNHSSDRPVGEKLSALAGILDFFIPADVLTAVLLVFTMENTLEHVFTTYVPEGLHGVGWFLVYVLGVGSIGILNYVSADDEEREDLSADLDDI